MFLDALKVSFSSFLIFFVFIIFIGSIVLEFSNVKDNKDSTELIMKVAFFVSLVIGIVTFFIIF